MDQLNPFTEHDHGQIIDQLDRGQVAFERCDFLHARQLMSQVQKNPHASLSNRMKASYYIFRCDLEEGRNLDMDLLIDELESINNPYADYFLAALYVLTKRPFVARRKALKIIRTSNQIELKQKALLVYADCLAQVGKYQRAIKIIEKIPNDYDDLYFCKEITLARLYLMVGDQERSGSLFLKTFHELFGTDYWYYTTKCLVYYANFLRLTGKPEQTLAMLQLIPQDLLRSMKQVSQIYDLEMRAITAPIDIIYDTSKRIVHLQSKHSVSLGNQNILIRLLLLFLKNPHRQFSKEELINKVWEEEYDPLIHDNKIYYSINRLRKILGHTKDNAIILSHGLSYGLNKNLKVEIQ